MMGCLSFFAVFCQTHSSGLREEHESNMKNVIFYQEEDRTTELFNDPTHFCKTGRPNLSKVLLQKVLNCSDRLL